MVFYHPKYYKELRKQYRDSIEALPRNGESLVPSSKQQASSDKPQAEGSRPGRPSAKHQASSSKLIQKIPNSIKPQATSLKRQAGRVQFQDTSTTVQVKTIRGSWIKGLGYDKSVVRMCHV